MQHPGCVVGGAKRKTEYAYTTSTSSGQAPGNLTTITKYLDESTTVATTMAYDDDGKMIKKIEPTGETSYTYDEDGNIDAVTTDQGTWEYEYDAEGRLSIVTDPFSHTRSREYDEDGNVNAVKVNGETVSTYTYDTDGNLIERTDAEGNVYQFDYNAPSTGSGQAPGQLVGQTDPEGASFQYEYDANGRLSKTIDGNGNEIFREYGSDDTSSSGSAWLTCSGTSSSSSSAIERLQKIIYPTFTKEFRYDEEGRVSEEIYALNENETSSVTYTYDAFGRLQSTTGPDGQSTTYVYDRMGRRIRVDDPSGQTKFEYDNWDNLVALTDAKNQRTEFEYDTLGRLKTEIRPMLQETSYEYYPAGSGQDAGRLWKIIDAKLQVTEYGYDAQGRLETISYADGRTVTLNYDADGNLAGYSDGETSAEYDYDDLGRKIWERVNYGAFTKEFSYSYYKNGLKKTFTAPDGTMYEYGYGNNNELREERIPGLGAVTIPDYTWNRPAKMIFPGGTQRMYGYDALMRLQALTVTDPGGNPLLDYAYTYDPTGNIVTKATEHGTYGYDYDASSRLITADNPVLNDEAYTYDNVGNRLTSADVSGTWNYNANNELLGYADVEYEYDANGNMIQKRVGTAAVNYIYNADNRLIRVEDELSGTVIAEYYYDPFGQRLWKEVNGVKTYFFYADEGLVAEFDATGTELRSYGYQPDSTWTRDPLFLKQDGEYYFYQNDHLGTPQKLVGVNGAVVWSAVYRSFGNAEVDVETITNNLRFPGQYHDEETGLHYNFQRYYDPKIGRYVQKDPIGFVSGDTNLYEYGENNPLSFVDLIGLADLRNHLSIGIEALRVAGLDREVNNQDMECFLSGLIAPDMLGINLVYDGGKIPKTQALRLKLEASNIHQKGTDADHDLYEEEKFKIIVQDGEIGYDVQDGKSGEESKEGGKRYGMSLKELEEILQALESLDNMGLEYVMKKLPEPMKKLLKKPTERFSYWWNQSSIIAPILKITPYVKDTGIIRTHYGDLVYLHGMGESGGYEAARAIRDNLIKVTNVRLNEFKTGNTCCDAYFALGQAIHYLTDTWTPSHTVREADGRISMFQDYSDQNLNEHVRMDNLYKYDLSLYGEAFIRSGDMILDALRAETAEKIDSSGYYVITKNAKVGIPPGINMEKRPWYDILWNGYKNEDE